MSAPAEMNDQIVDELKSREDTNGLVRLDRTEFTSGCRLATVGGAMLGHFGLYQGMGRKDRCRVLYEIFGTARIVDVPMEYLRLAV